VRDPFSDCVDHVVRKQVGCLALAQMSLEKLASFTPEAFPKDAIPAYEGCSRGRATLQEGGQISHALA
jgi:hypothetical protein